MELSFTTPKFAKITVRVLSLVGIEEVSTLARWDLVILIPKESVSVPGFEREVLKAEVKFKLGPDAVLRGGLVASCRYEGLHGNTDKPLARYAIQIVPSAWLLTMRRNSRIFQDKHVHEIASAVLGESSIRHRWMLEHKYKRRPYCTQYDETDWEFLTRIFAEEGIFFFFDFDESFEGGDPAKFAADKDEHDTRIGYLEDASKVVGGLKKEIAGITQDAKSEKAEGIDAAAGSGLQAIAGMATDMKSQPKNDPVALKPGVSGPEGGGDILVFVDAPTGWGEAKTGHGEPLVLDLVDDSGLLGPSDVLTDLCPVERVASEHVELRDYDFERPLTLLKARKGKELKDKKPGMAMEAYHHHGDYEVTDVDDEAAVTRLEQHRRHAVTMTGRGRSPNVCAGHAFSVRGRAKDATVKDGKYAVASVRHEYHELDEARAPQGPQAATADALVVACARAIHQAFQRGGSVSEDELRTVLWRSLDAPSTRAIVYQCFVSCAPADKAVRPPPPPRPMRNVTESATVVGPQGKDVHLDKYGRVKVQFHWDREGSFTDKSSCWIRVVQPWAGAGYGFQFFPRIGMEVLVTFLGGDPDRPVIIGALYNGTHATPELLPEGVTRSSIRTQSTPDGGGFNELAFEDKKGIERVYIHAQRDLEALVRNDTILRVRNRSMTMIGGDADTGVGGRSARRVGGDDSEIVGGNSASSVAKRRVISTGGDEERRVEGNLTETIGGLTTRRVHGGQLEAITGMKDVTVYGDAFLQVCGPVKGDGAARAGQNAVAFVEGLASVTATRAVVVRAEAEDETSSSIRLECGKSAIVLYPDRILLESPKIDMRAIEVTAKGDEAFLTLNDQGAELQANPVRIGTPDGARLTAKKDEVDLVGPSLAQVRGMKINMTSPSHAAADAPTIDTRTEEPLQDLKLFFTHLWPEGKTGIGETRCRVVAGDFVYEGKTDSAGKCTARIPEGTKDVQITLFANESHDDLYPKTTGPLRWNAVLVDSLGEPGKPAGARMRLRNLGYDPGGADLQAPATDPSTERAIIQLQLDLGERPAGDLDDAAAKQLKTTYGS